MEYIFTNRVLLSELHELLERSITEIDCTFETSQVHQLGSHKWTELTPLTNKTVVPEFHYVEVHNKMFLVHSPDDFFENHALYYWKHFDFIFEGEPSKEDIENGDFEYVDEIHLDHLELTVQQKYVIHEQENFSFINSDSPTLVLSADTSSHGQIIKSFNPNILTSLYIYESTDWKDDRVIIITEKYNPDNGQRMINFFDGEEITDIDIENKPTI